VARHDLSLRLPKGVEIEHADLEIVVREDGALLGRILISRGSIDWRPARKQRGHKLNWTAFARLMEEQPESTTRLPRRHR
jgi:hypothetical protein